MYPSGPIRPERNNREQSMNNNTYVSFFTTTQIYSSINLRIELLRSETYNLDFDRQDSDQKILLILQLLASIRLLSINWLETKKRHLITVEQTENK